MTTPKLCRDCVNCFDSTYGLKCGHPNVPLRDLATGERQYARFVRDSADCGVEAKLFEQKPPPPRKISRWQRFVWRMWRWSRS